MTSAAPRPSSASPRPSRTRAFQRCINPDCAAEYPVQQVLVSCPKCKELLDVAYEWGATMPRDWSFFALRSGTRGGRNAAGTAATAAALDFSGVWRFRDLLPFYSDESQIVTIGEGRTNLQMADQLAGLIGVDVKAGGKLFLQYEGFNPSGSFKDNGMCAGFTHARMVGARAVACASTGNTSASLAVYATLAGIPSYVFIGEGKIAYGKLAQALDYGAKTLQVAGDFDACLARIRHIAEHMPELGVYLMNSVNPFRLEGQKTIMYRVLEGLDWQVPDWIIVPGGNLGNCSAFGKAFAEAQQLGLIDRLPRLAIINAQGSRTLDRVYNELGVRWNGGRYDRAKVKAEFERMDAANERAHTIATAIEINRPVNLPKALRALELLNGVVRSVDDHCIVEHKALVGRLGFGCEPASAASLAGARTLIREGVIKPHETVVCILTGHALKDPDVTVNYHMGLGGARAHSRGGSSDSGFSIPLGRMANPPTRVADDLDSIVAAMGIRRS
jgi:threonine synthase